MPGYNTSTEKGVAAGQSRLEREYWVEQLNEGWQKGQIVPQPPWPIPEDTGQRDTVSFSWTGELFQRLIKVTGGSDTRLHMVLTAVAGVLLRFHAPGGPPDVVLGSPIYKQKTEGQFINTLLPLRVSLDDTTTFRTLLAQVKETVSSAVKHQNYPMDALLYQLGLTASAGDFPLFDAVLLVENVHDAAYLESISPGVLFSFLRTEEDVRCRVEFKGHLYDTAAMERLAGHFTTLADTLLFQVDEPVLSADILSGEEKRLLLEAFNDTHYDYPGDLTIHALFEARAQSCPENEAVIMHGDRREALTYRQLETRANALAYRLKSEGVEPGRIAGLATGPCTDFAVGILGILKAGGAYLPIDPQLPMERIRYMLDDSNACGVVISLDRPVSLPRSMDRFITAAVSRPVAGGEEAPAQWDVTAEKYGEKYAAVEAGPNDPAVVIYTSGSTGRPKGVVVEHRNIVNYTQWRIRRYRQREGDASLQLISPSFDGFGANFYPALCCGGRVVMMEEEFMRDVVHIRRVVREEKVTDFSVVPAMQRMILDGASIDDFVSLRFVALAGERADDPLLQQTRQLMPNARIINEYGPTENTIATAANLNLEPGQAGIVGTPVDNHRAFILDTGGNLRPLGVPGELWVTGAGVARGYLNRPELTSESFINPDSPQSFNRSHRSYQSIPLYKTGDLARWSTNGALELLGRIDQQVQVRGYRVEPGEIESHLAAHQSVREAVVLPRKSSDQGGYMTLCAYAAGTPDLTPADLRGFLTPRLPEYMIPTQWVLLEQIPLTPTGKTDRRALAQMEIASASATEYLAPRTPTETQLADMWQQFLGLEQVGVKDNFFNIGGDSIKNIGLLNLIKTEYGISLELVDLYENDTVEKLALLVENRRETPPEPIAGDAGAFFETLKQQVLDSGFYPADNVEDVFPMSDIQEGMLFYSLSRPGEAVYRQQMSFLLNIPDLDPPRLKRALELAVRKHPMLRTGFDPERFDVPIQVVYRDLPVDVRVENLSRLDPPQRIKHIDDILRRDRETPFTLSPARPLWRMAVFTLDRGDILLLWMGHHAVIDGWSSASLMTELNNIYHRLAQEPSFVPEPLKNTYKAFVADQQKRKQDEQLHRFWERELEGYRRLEFPAPAVTPPPPVMVKTRVRHLDLLLLEALKNTAAETGSTVKNLCFAAYMGMLNLLSRDNDVTAGLVANNRPLCEDGDKIVGCFLNTLPVRLRIPGAVTYGEFVQCVEQRLRELKRYEALSLFQIVRLTGEEAGEGNPLFDTLFNFVDFHVYSRAQHVEAAGEHGTTPADVDARGDINTPFNLDVNITMGRFDMMLAYSPAFVDEVVAALLGSAFETFLRRMVEQPERVMDKADFLPDEQKHKLLEELNDTTVEFPGETRTIHGLFHQQAARTPDAPALVFPGDTRTYAQLAHEVQTIAALLEERGIRPGDIVAVMLPPSPDMAVALLGILSAGGAYLPIDPGYPEERIKYILSDSAASILLTTTSPSPPEPLADCTDRFVTCPQANLPPGIQIIDMKSLHMPLVEKTQDVDGVSDWDRLQTCPYETESAGQGIAYIIYTSGTTGRPKGVMVEHRSVVNTLLHRRDVYHLDGTCVCLQLFSFVFDGFVTAFFTPLVSGARAVFPGGDGTGDIAAIEEAVIRHEVTHFIAVPSLFRVIAETLEPGQARSLRVVTLAGERFQPELCTLVRQKFPNLELVNEFGVTEASVLSTLYRNQHRGPVIKIGRPIANARVYILDNHLQLLPPGVAGELCIGGAGVALGYLNQPELTAANFVCLEAGEKGDRQKNSPLYLSGDLARWLPDGQLEYLGRVDQQVKIRGFRIELNGIEAVLLQHPKIKEAVAVPLDGSQLCAYVVPTEGAAPGVPELRSFLSNYLPAFQVPGVITVLGHLPRTPGGKVDFKSLPKPGAVETEVAYTAPGDELETRLTELWAGILKVEQPIGIDHHFFHLGGHSLNAAVLLARVHRDMQVRVPLPELFRRPSVRQLAAYIRGAAPHRYLHIPPAEPREHYPLSTAQKRLYLVQQMAAESTAYNMPQVMELATALEKEELETAFRKLVHRHETLRTSFHLADGEPVQVIHPPDTIDLNIETHPASSSPLSLIRPFDLSTAPLLRVALSQPGDGGKQLLLVDMHHIVSDGISQRLMVEDFLALLENRPLPELPLQYKDYAAWQSTRLSTQEGRAETLARENFWLETFAGDIPVLDIPLDFPRPAVQRFDGAAFSFRLPAPQTEALKQLAQKQETTLYQTLLALFNIFLSRLSNSEDIVVGTPVAGRRHPDLETVIGMFVNTLALRNFPAGEKTIPAFIHEVKERALRAFENQDYPFEELVEKAGVTRDAGRNPLFDIAFTLRGREELTAPTGEAATGLIPLDLDIPAAKFDLTLDISETADALDFTFLYAVSLFKPQTIERFANILHTLISSVLSAPDTTIAETDILTEAEKQQLLETFNDTATGYPRAKTLHALFEEQAERFPHRIAVVAPGSPVLTYDDLNRRASHLAGELISKGVQPGDIVGLLADRSAEMLIGIMGILKTGAAYLPIDPEFPEERMTFMLADCNARILLTTPERLPDCTDRFVTCPQANLPPGFQIADMKSLHTPLPAEAQDVNGVRSWDRLQTWPYEQESAGNDVAYIIYTSGSTGKPKGTVTTHANAVRVVRETNYIQLTPEDRVLQLSNYAFDGSVFDVFGALLNGSALVLVDKEDILEIERLGQLIRRESITVFFVTTALFNALVDVGIHCFDTVRKVLFGGERVSVDHVRRALAHLGPGRVLHMYGPTETTVYATAYEINHLPEAALTVPIGPPISNTAVYILDKHHNPVPIGVTGEIHIGGDGVCPGYLNRPELTAERFIEYDAVFNRSHRSYSSYPTARLYKSGDLGRWLPDGTVEFVGRVDHQVKLRGFRVELGEIEARLAEHEAVVETVVVVREDTGGKVLCAYATTAAGEERETLPTRLRSYLQERLPQYMVPASFTVLDTFPLTPSGKINRKALPAPRVTAGDTPGTEAPAGDIEELLAETWAGVLGVQGIGRMDNYFEMGGDSIKAVQVSARLREKGYKMDIRDLFVNPTVGELAPCIRRLEQDIPQHMEEGEAPLTPIQQWFFQRQFTDAHHLNQSVMLFRPEGFDEEILKPLFRELLMHHDGLRTVFPAGEPPRAYNRGEAGAEVDISLIDCTNGVDVETTVRETCTRIQSGLDIHNGPLLKLGLFRTPEGDHLLIGTHHLLVDGVSWRILLEDFAAGYRQISSGQEVRFPLKTHAFRYWADGLNTFAAGENLFRQLRYWETVAAAGVTPLPRAREAAPRERTYGDVQRVNLTLGAEQTAALTGAAHRAYGTEMNDLLLTGLVLAVRRWAGSGAVPVTLEGHGREPILPDVDISRTVGWFTTRYPVVLDPTPGENIHDPDRRLGYTIKSVKETLRKVPDKGIGYGLLKYLAPPGSLKGVSLDIEPEIVFNYLGGFGGGEEGEEPLFVLSPLDMGDGISPRLEQISTLSIDGMHMGPEINLTISYSGKEFDEPHIRELAEAYRTALEDIIRHCTEREGGEITPSDLGYSGVDIDELDELEDELEDVE